LNCLVFDKFTYSYLRYTCSTHSGVTCHAVLLSGNYEQMQSFGDQLLKDTGVIRIPFYSSDRFFQLVIDSRNKRIYTEDDSHPFQPKWPSKLWSELLPFNVSFDQIKTLSQKAGHWHGIIWDTRPISG
jgi:hypothetical protein